MTGFPLVQLAGLAHITGGGIRENLNRVLPDNVDAQIDLGRYRPQAGFQVIRDSGAVSNDVMLHSYNLDVGLVLICATEHQQSVLEHLQGKGK